MDNSPTQTFNAAQAGSSPMKTMTTIQQRLAFDSTFALGIKVLSLPLGLLTPLVIARFWGAHNFGVFTLATYIVTILSVVCRLGLDTGMLRFGANLRATGQSGDILELFWRGLALILCLSCAAGVGSFLLKDKLSQLFHAPALPQVLSLVLLALPLMAAAVFCSETLRSLGRARWVVTQQDFLAPVGMFVMIICLGWKCQEALKSPASLGLVFLLNSALGLGFLAAVLASYLKTPRERANRYHLMDLIRYSWPLYLSILLLLVFSTMDSLLLGFFTDPEQVAYYEAASRASLVVNLPLIAVNAVVPPLFAQMHQRERLQELESLAQAASRWMYYMSLPLAIFMAALAPDILELFGSGFGEGSWALRILIVAQLFNVACGPVGFMLAMTGHQYTLTANLALGGAVGFPLLAVGAAVLGLNGLALTKGLWLVGVSILMSVGVWRCLRLKVFARSVGWANASAAAGLAAFLLIRRPVGPWGAAAGGTLVYLLLMARTLYEGCSDILFLS